MKIQKKNNLIDEIKPGLNNLILIGPEGDFSKSEIALCNSMNFKDISLGNSRLTPVGAGSLVNSRGNPRLIRLGLESS